MERGAASELQSAFRKRRDQSWMFPRSAYGCIVSEPDSSASVMGKAMNSGANLLPLHPCWSHH